MNLFESIKAAVTLRQAAEYYGLRIAPNGMARCPFHADKHPSLKLNEDYFFCFGCGAAGDVIDFTARLFELSCYEAAQKLASDFGIPTEPRQAVTDASKSKPPQWHQFRLEEIKCRRVLTDYLHLLRAWKTCYAPRTPEESLDDRFVAGCQQYDCVADLLDFLTQGNPAERYKVVSTLMADGSLAVWEARVSEDRKETEHRGNESEIA